ncbi:helix-turn-helix transcriptional regulator [Mesorhizobium sp. CCNWLW179]|nr:helix-turn-helix transcriptional regulator [Mesorhizobium zhangyense]
MQNVHYSVPHYSEQICNPSCMKLAGRLSLNVQRLRRDKKLSQEGLAFLAGHSRAYISGVEAGRRNVTLETLEDLAEALEVEATELIRPPASEPKT